MVQKLLQSPSNGDVHAAGSINESVPLESSCRMSSELNPDDYFFEWSTEMNGFTGNGSNKSWSKKLKQMKQSSITQKLKASRAENGSKTNNRYMRMAKRNSFRNIDKVRYKISSIDRETEIFEADSHRRSFSGVIQRHSATKSSSSYSSTSSSASASFSFSSSGFCDLQLLKRINSANSEIECSIEGAIAHCKQSQKLGVCSLSASKISLFGDQERSELCII